MPKPDYERMAEDKGRQVIEMVKELVGIVGKLDEAAMERVGAKLQAEMDAAEEDFDKVFPGWRG